MLVSLLLEHLVILACHFRLQPAARVERVVKDLNLELYVRLDEHLDDFRFLEHTSTHLGYNMLLHGLIAQVLVIRLLDNLARLAVRRGKYVLYWYVVLRLYFHLVLIHLLFLVAHDEMCEWVCLLFFLRLLLCILGACANELTCQLLMLSLWHHIELTTKRGTWSCRPNGALGGH